MYEVTIRKSFSAAHKLDIGGKCEELHGHNFFVDVTIGTSELNSEGLVIDFRVLKAWTSDILEDLDHTFLNDLPFFQGTNPSSETIARYIYEKLEERLTSDTLVISHVTVWESENAWARYRGAKRG